MCLNQFHDIISGSSISPVYVEPQRQYAEVREIGEKVRYSALTAIADRLGGDVLLIKSYLVQSQRSGSLEKGEC